MYFHSNGYKLVTKKIYVVGMLVRAFGVLFRAGTLSAGGARVLRRGSFGSLLLSFECYWGSCGTLCGSHEREKCGVL